MTNGLKLNVGEKQIYVRVHEVSRNAPNILFIMTPIVSVCDPFVDELLSGLVGQGVNIFALDLMGTGMSDGTAEDTTYINFKASVMEVIRHIQSGYSGQIHFYGGTGTGGIIGQALCADVDIGKHMTSFIQYGIGIHSNLSPIGNTTVLRLLYPFIKFYGKRLKPSKKMKFKLLKYEGVNAEKEEAWYRKMMKAYPGAFDLSYSMLSTLFGLFLDSNSTMKNPLACPVLVLASHHDRYFKKAYVEAYYEEINTRKEIRWYDDSHLAFHWRAEELNQDILKWVGSF